MIRISVYRARASAGDPEVLTAGMSRAVSVQFCFSDDWAGLGKTAVFTDGERTIDVPELAWVDGTCPVPQEVLASAGRIVRVGVYGLDTAKSVVLPTVWAELGRVREGADPSGDTAAAPTPSAVQLVLAAAADALRCRSEAATAEQGAKSAQTAAETAGQAAKAAGAEASSLAAAAAASESNAAAAAEAAGRAGAEALAAGQAAQSARDTAAAKADLAAQKAAEAAAAAAGADYQQNAANALKATLSGTALTADDVSPLAHSLLWTQYGQCVQEGTPAPNAQAGIAGRAAGASAGDGTNAVQLTVLDGAGAPVTLYGIPVASGGNVTIGTQQYVADTADDKGLVTRRVGKLVLDGAAAGHKFNTSASTTISGTARAIFLAQNVVNAPGSTRSDGKCTHLLFNNPTASNDCIYISEYGKSLYAFLSACGTLEQANAWLAAQNAAGTPVTVYYLLASAAAEQGSVSPAAVPACSPVTAWSSAAHSEVVYNRDAIRVIGKLTAAIAALGGTV